MINYLLDSKIEAQDMLANKELDDFIQFNIPFNSKRKRATCAVRHPTQKGKIRVFVKGAPEIVIESCDFFIGQSGKP